MLTRPAVNTLALVLLAVVLVWKAPIHTRFHSQNLKASSVQEKPVNATQDGTLRQTASHDPLHEESPDETLPNGPLNTISHADFNKQDNHTGISHKDLPIDHEKTSPYGGSSHQETQNEISHEDFLDLDKNLVPAKYTKQETQDDHSSEEQKDEKTEVDGSSKNHNVQETKDDPSRKDQKDQETKMIVRAWN